jgi:hypothetical protein
MHTRGSEEGNRAALALGREVGDAVDLPVEDLEGGR